MYTCTKNTLATKGTTYDFKPCILIYFIFSLSIVFTTMLGSYYALERMDPTTGSQKSLETRMVGNQLREHSCLYLSYTPTTIIPYATTSRIFTTTISPTNFIFCTTTNTNNYTTSTTTTHTTPTTTISIHPTYDTYIVSYSTNS
jgi:hypothetical protein